MGPATAKRLHALGIYKASDLRQWDEATAIEKLGKHGAFLRDLAHGIDDREVDPSQEMKSCGSETTFEHDILDIYKLIDFIEALSQDVATALKDGQKPGRTITLKLKYSDFQSITRSKTLNRFTDDAKRIAEIATHLLRENTEAGTRPVRLIGVSVSSLRDENEPEQLWLNFPEPF